jgi:hypothetical protein
MRLHLTLIGVRVRPMGGFQSCTTELRVGERPYGPPTPFRPCGSTIKVHPPPAQARQPFRGFAAQEDNVKLSRQSLIG